MRPGYGFSLFFIVFWSVFCLQGCSSDSSPSQPRNGQFSAGEIVGLGFATPSQKGHTSRNGTFLYQEGETICFHVGDIALGCTKAQAHLSVEDLVPETADGRQTAVAQIWRFLRSLDSYDNAFFSIHIDARVHAAALGKTFDFSESSPDELKELVEELLTGIYPGRRDYLVSEEHAAQASLHAALFAQSAGTDDPQTYLPICFGTPLVIVTTPLSDITVDLEGQAVDVYVINNPDASGANPCNCLSDEDAPGALSKDAFQTTGTIRTRGCSTAGAIKSQFSVEVEWPDPESPPKNPSHTAHFLGMTHGGKKWVFNDAGMVDPSRIRNPLSFHLQRELGKQTGSNAWAPRTKYFELFIVTGSSGTPTPSVLTSGNRYRGVYILMEDIHNGTHRIPIEDWAPDPNGNMVGPMILQINHSYTTETDGQYYTANDGTKVAHYQEVLPPSPPAHANVGSPLCMKMPNSKSFFDLKNDATPINTGDLDRIRQWFYTPDSPPYSSAPPFGWVGHFDFPPDSCLSSPPTPDAPPKINLGPSPAPCYACSDAACFFENLQETTDFQSFVEYFLLNELVKDPDGYHKSTFMYKTADTGADPDPIVPGKVFAGPLWDKNKSYGNYGDSVPSPCPDSVTESQWADTLGFLYCAQEGGQSPWWWSVLLLSDEFTTMASTTWIAATTEGGILAEQTITDYIDEQQSYLDNKPYPSDPAKTGTGAIQRELQRWPGLVGIQTADDWRQAVSHLEDWIANGYTDANGTKLPARVQWLTDNLPVIGIKTTNE